MDIAILGNGQIWDVTKIRDDRPEAVFEDLFSGRSLKERALAFDRQHAADHGGRAIFGAFLEEGKTSVTGRSVTLAFESGNEEAVSAAQTVLDEMAVDCARAVEMVTKGTAVKEAWTENEKKMWQDIRCLVIGGGVSRGETGRYIIEKITGYFRKDPKLRPIDVFQGRYPGKESGILGAVAYAVPFILHEGEFSQDACIIGIDFGRTELGVGVVRLDLRMNKIYPAPSTQGTAEGPFLFYKSVSTYDPDALLPFADACREYSEEERARGIEIRTEIVRRIVDLTREAIDFTKAEGLSVSRNIGVGSPGEVSKDNWLVSSTQYLPFFQEKDGFRLGDALRRTLEEGEGFTPLDNGSSDDAVGTQSENGTEVERAPSNNDNITGFNFHIVNDGIAAGLANIRFGLASQEEMREGRYMFLGPGSGLGGGLFYVRP
ncbi:MAG: hypothetical protein JW844_00010 [Candidatus Omnitrophica bacterium]|nr:hypothetical protein [Candidatus Omnitrophota bacterium]